MISFIKENAVAIGILLIILVFLIRGLKKGLITMAFSVAPVVLTLLVSARLEAVFIGYMHELHVTETVAGWLSGILINKAGEKSRFLIDLFRIDVLAEDAAGTLADTALKIVSFIILFIVIRLIVKLVLRILNGVKRISIIKFVDRLSGGLLGAAEGMLWSWFVVALIMVFSVEPVLSFMHNEMQHAPMLKSFIENNLIYDFMMRFF